MTRSVISLDDMTYGGLVRPLDFIITCPPNFFDKIINFKRELLGAFKTILSEFLQQC